MVTLTSRAQMRLPEFALCRSNQSLCRLGFPADGRSIGVPSVVSPHWWQGRVCRRLRCLADYAMIFV